ncbi:MAG: hypothetical protein WD271_00985 [Acidimicrobiia bacterium]
MADALPRPFDAGLHLLVSHGATDDRYHRALGVNDCEPGIPASSE